MRNITLWLWLALAGSVLQLIALGSMVAVDSFATMGPFEIVQTDGNPRPEDARLSKDTVNIGPGEHYDAIWEAREPGKWLFTLPHPAPRYQQ